jgi:hypothetical protein
MHKKILPVFLVITILTQLVFGTYVTAFANDIKIDGSTKTHINYETNNVTNISTETVKNNNAFNSFKVFDVSQNNIVNLFLPENTENLINLVHNQASYIDGTLNSIKNNQIGGNVYFLNPHGIMIGAEGIINVGSLTAVTPTPTFMNSVFDSPNVPSMTAVNTIMNGSLPINSSGLISISGKVNAIKDIELNSANVTVTSDYNHQGEVVAGADYSNINGKNNDRVHFSDVVNVRNLKTANNISVENGNIRITAQNNFTNQGNISADGSSNVNAGNIDIDTGNDINLKEGSIISAKGQGDNSSGGNIIMIAENDSFFEKEAIVDAGADSNGDGGFIELSAKEEVNLAGGEFLVNSTNGKNGNVYIDPSLIRINDNTNLYGSHVWESDKIIVEPNVVVSGQNLGYNNYSHGDAFDITLKAAHIELRDGSKLLANAINYDGDSYTGGTIELIAHIEANDITDGDNYLTKASSSVIIDNAEIKAGNIIIDSKAMAQYSWDYQDSNYQLVRDSLTNVAQANVETDSKITISGNSNIEASNKLDIRSSTNTTAYINPHSDDQKTIKSVALIKGDIISNSQILIGNGTILAADQLNINSINNTNIDITATSASTGSSDSSSKAAVALISTEVHSTSDINQGVQINANDLTINAENQNSFSVNALALAPKDAKAGIAATIFDANTSTTAGYSGEYITGDNYSYNKLNSININSLNSNIKNATSAVTTTLAEDASSSSVIGSGNKALDTVNTKLGNTSKMDSSSQVGHLRMAGAVSYAENNQNAISYIGDQTQIDAAGEITVDAKVKNEALENRAISTVQSKDDSETTNSYSSAVTYGNYKQDAQAFTGKDTVLKGNVVNINSEVIKERTGALTDWSSLINIINNIINISNVKKGGQITSYTNAVGSAENSSIAGSITYMNFDNSSKAYTDLRSEIYTPELNINALNTIKGIYVSGNLNGLKAGVTAKKAVGGSYSQINYDNTTRAYLLEDTIISGRNLGEDTPIVYPNINIRAENTTDLISISPTAGKGSTFGFNGTFSLGKVNNITEASISNKTHLETNNINIEAKNNINNWSLSGAINRTENNGVGAGVALNDVNSETKAFIGDNSYLRSDEKYIIQSGDTLSDIADQYNTTVEILKNVNNIEDENLIQEGEEIIIAYDQGSIKTKEVNLNAKSKGNIETIAVAGVDNSENNKYGDNIDNNKLNDSDVDDYSNQTSSAVTDASSNAKPTGGTKPSFGLGISGSVAYNTSNINTKAYLEKSYLDFTEYNDSSIDLRAINNTDFKAYSGSASLMRTNKDSTGFKVSMVGSLAVNQLNNNTRAYFNDLNVIGNENSSLYALSGGEARAVALGAAVKTGAKQPSLAIAGSVSINKTNNTTEAYITGSEITTNNPNQTEEEEEETESNIITNLKITSYDRTKLGTGGGSLLVNSKAGVGTAISYSDISNETNTYISNTTVQDYNNIELNSFNGSKIASGAAMGAVSFDSGSMGLAGSFAINKIINTTSAEVKNNSLLKAKDKVDIQAKETDNIKELDDLIEQNYTDNSDAHYNSSPWNDRDLSDQGNKILSVAGLLQGTGNNIGVSMVWNDVKNNINASVSNSVIETNNKGQVNVKSHSNTDITGIAVGAGISTNQFAGAASVVINDIAIINQADIYSNNNDFIRTNNLTVKSEDGSYIDSLSGQVTASIGKAALGGAVINNNLDNSINTKIEGINLISNHTSINSIQSGKLRGLAVSGAGSSGITLNASVINSNIYTDTKANLINVNSANEQFNNYLTLTANDNFDIEAISGSVAGGAVAVGGAVTNNYISGETEASIDTSENLNTLKLGKLIINSDTDKSVIAKAYQGGLGYYFSGGAAVALNNVDYNQAGVIEEGSTIQLIEDNEFQLKTSDKINIESDAQGYQASGAAVGAVIADSQRSGNTIAVIGRDTNQDQSIEKSILEFDNSGEVLVSSTREGKVKSSSITGSAGVATINGTVSIAKDTGNVHATLNNTNLLGTQAFYNSSYYGNGTTVDLYAVAKPYVEAETRSYSGSVLGSVAALKAKAVSNLDIEASSDKDTDIKAQDLRVISENKISDYFDSGENKFNVRSYSEGVSGSALLGANAALSDAINNSIVKSYIASDININENVEIIADNISKQVAEVTGITAAGVAVGFNKATAESDTLTIAVVGDLKVLKDNETGERDITIDENDINFIIGDRSYKGSLTIKAKGNSSNYADSISGSGGVISGSAAVAETINNNKSIAEIANNVIIGKNRTARTDLYNIENYNDVLAFEGDDSLNNILRLQNVNIEAIQNTIFDTSANSIEAAVVGMSGAKSKNTVNSFVEVNLGNNSAIFTSESYWLPSTITINANNIIDQVGSSKPNAKASAGGVINGSAAESITYITQNTSINIGENVTLFAYGNPYNLNNGIRVNSYNSLNTDDEAILTTGGVVESPYAETVLIAGNDNRDEDNREFENTDHYLKAKVNIGSNSNLISFGAIETGAYSTVRSNNNALVKAYGALGFAGGKALSFIDSTQQINLDPNSYLMAYDNISLRAGQKGDGSVNNRLNSSARTDVYNNTALPLSTSIEAFSSISNSSLVNISDETIIDGVQDVYLSSQLGSTTAEGYGEGHNPYLDSVGSKKTGGDSKRSLSANIIADGLVNAGIFNNKKIHIKSENDVELNNLNENVYNIKHFNPYKEVEDQIDDLKSQKERAEQRGDQVDISRLEGEIEVLEMLQNILPNSDGQLAIEVKDMFSSGGNITVNSRNLLGNGELTAQGGPKIEVINDTSYHLVLNQLVIPDRDTGGNIYLNGVINNYLPEANINSINADQNSKITIENRSNYGEPSIFLKDGVYNRRGLLEIYNKKGSLAMFGEVNAKETKINIPNGAVIINNPSGIYNIDADPMAAWYSDEELPSDADIAAEYIANAMASGEVNTWLRDPQGKMYILEKEGKTYAEGGGYTIVFGNKFPNIHDSDAEGSNDIELFKNFWMEKVSSRSLYKTKSNYPTVENPDQPALSGQVIGINADKININGKIRAGSPVNWDININSSIDQWISDQNTRDKVLVPEQYYSLGENINNKYYLEYDFNKGQLILGDINASGGGYLYLHGDIVSTNPAGNIEILNGLGNVEINNQSSKKLLINNINTGTTAEGMVKIVDTLKGETNWYVNTPGEAIQHYYLNRTYNTEKPDAPINSISPGNLNYSPKDGVRYEWTRSATIKRDLFGEDGYIRLVYDTKDEKRDWFYDYRSNMNDWYWSNIYDEGANVTDRHWLNHDEGFVFDPDNNIVFEQTITGHVDSYKYGVKKITDDGPVCYSSGISTRGLSVVFSDWKNKGLPDGETWEYRMPSEATINVKNSLKADNNIHISFKGTTGANLLIKSDPGLIIGGVIDNLKGDTVIRTALTENDHYGGSITQYSSAIINTNNIDIFADNGIGTNNQPINISLKNNSRLIGGTIKGNVNISAPRDNLNLGMIASWDNSNVKLTADGNIASQNSRAVVGGDITLISKNGEIGSNSNSFKIDSEGNLEAQAMHDINIEEVKGSLGGDLRLSRVHSTIGDVKLTVNSGKIVDAIRDRQVDLEKQRQLADMIKQRLHLTEEHGAYEDAENTTLNPYLQSAQKAYQQYWNLIDKGYIDENGDYQLKTDSIEFYKPRVGMNASDTAVLDYTRQRLDSHISILDKVLKDGWQEHNPLADNVTFQSVLDDNKYNTQTSLLSERAAWNDAELEYQINQNALLPESNTQLIRGDLNIKGEDISLSVRDDIGRFDDQPVIIYLNSKQELTQEQAAALASAHLPGDIKITYDDNKKAEFIKINQIRPVYVNGRTKIKSNSSTGDTFITNTEGSLNIDQIDSLGEIRLIARDNITNYSYGNKNYALNSVNGTAIVLEAGEGSIGTTTNPLTIESGYLGSVRAGEDIYIEKTLGDLSLNRIFAANHINLKSSGSIIGRQSGLSISSNSLNLISSRDIFGKGMENNENDSSLEIELKTGKLKANTVGDLNISSNQSLTTDVIKANNIDLFTRNILNISNQLSALDSAYLEADSIYEVADQDSEGYINAQNLSTVTTNGQGLYGENNIHRLNLINKSSSNVGLVNNKELNILRLEQFGNDLNIINNGDINIKGDIRLDNNNVTISSTGSINEINDSGRFISINFLEITSNLGQYLNNENQVQRLKSTNIKSGNISFKNTTENLYVEKINQMGENVSVSNSGTIEIGKVDIKDGNLDMLAGGSIINQNKLTINSNLSLKEQTNIIANNIKLESTNGSIGEIDNYIYIDSSNPKNSYLTAKSEEDIYLNEVDKDLNLKLIISKSGNIGIIADQNINFFGKLLGSEGKIKLTVGDSIQTYNGYQGEENDIIGKQIILTAENGSIGSSAKWLSINAIDLLNAEAKDDIFINQYPEDLRIQYIISRDGSINLDVLEGKIDAELISAESTIDLTSKEDIFIDKLKTEKFIANIIEDNEQITVNESDIKKSLDIKADNVNLKNINHIGLRKLYLDIVGNNENKADNIFVNISVDEFNNEQAVIFNKLYSNNIYINSDSYGLEFKDILLGSRADIYNKDYYVVIDNINKKLYRTDLQLYPENSHFYLKLREDRKMITDTFVVNYNPDFIINNFGTENSFIRIIDKLFQILNNDSIKRNNLERKFNNDFPEEFRKLLKTVLVNTDDISESVEEE